MIYFFGTFMLMAFAPSTVMLFKELVEEMWLRKKNWRKNATVLVAASLIQPIVFFLLYQLFSVELGIEKRVIFSFSAALIPNLVLTVFSNKFRG